MGQGQIQLTCRLILHSNNTLCTSLYFSIVERSDSNCYFNRRHRFQLTTTNRKSIVALFKLMSICCLKLNATTKQPTRNQIQLFLTFNLKFDSIVYLPVLSPCCDVSFTFVATNRTPPNITSKDTNLFEFYLE